ncbi:MAG: hypothetical protein HQK87_00150 [Nitrospinae bacterium]|nr:hypothetical protein [Nitrospinota bacterium]
MAKVGISEQGDTERIAKASTYARTPAQAEKRGPVGRAKTPGIDGAIISGGARGVLKQTNVGDVNSPVDQLADGNRASASKVRQTAKTQSAELTRQFQAQVSDKGGQVSSVG